MKTVSRFINSALTHLKETEEETESGSEGCIGNYSLRLLEEIDKRVGTAIQTAIQRSYTMFLQESAPLRE